MYGKLYEVIKMKKVFCVIFCLLIAALPFTVVAANESVINPEEKAIVDYVKSMADKYQVTIRAEDINAMENYFKTVDITAEQKDAIIAGIDSGIEIAKSDPAFKSGNLKDLATSTKNQLIKKISDVVSIVGLKVVYNSGTHEFQFINADTGVLVYKNELPIKQTGPADSYIFILIGVALVFVLAGISVTFVVYEKKRNRN